MTTRTAADHLAMMRSPNRWPHTFVLPLTKGRHPDKQYGYLYQPSVQVSCPPPEPVVYLGILGLGKHGERETRAYDSLEAVAADGWEVD